MWFYLLWKKTTLCCNVSMPEGIERFPSVNIYCMSPKGIALTLWQSNVATANNPFLVGGFKHEFYFPFHIFKISFDYHQPVLWSFRVDDFPTQKAPLISINYGGISRHRCFFRNAYVVSATEAGGSLALLHWSVSRGTLRRKSGTILDVHHPRESMEVSEKQMVAPGKRKKYITI